jgi:hypothetical protein
MDVIVQHYGRSKLFERTTLTYWEQRNGLLQLITVLDPERYYDVVLKSDKIDEIREQWRSAGISLEVQYARSGETESGLNNCYATYTKPPGVVLVGPGTVRSFSMSLPFVQHDPIRLREIDRMEARGAGAYAVFPKGDRAPFTVRITPDFITIS